MPNKQINFSFLSLSRAPSIQPYRYKKNCRRVERFVRSYITSCMCWRGSMTRSRCTGCMPLRKALWNPRLLLSRPSFRLPKLKIKPDLYHRLSNIRTPPHDISSPWLKFSFFFGSIFEKWRYTSSDVHPIVYQKRWVVCRSWTTVSCLPVFIQDASQTAQIYLLYTRFRSVSAPLSSLPGKLERRANAYPEELSASLTCHSAYFSARMGLLMSRLVEQIRGSIKGG